MEATVKIIKGGKASETKIDPSSYREEFDNEAELIEVSFRLRKHQHPLTGKWRLAGQPEIEATFSSGNGPFWRTYATRGKRINPEHVEAILAAIFEVPEFDIVGLGASYHI